MTQGDQIDFYTGVAGVQCLHVSSATPTVHVLPGIFEHSVETVCVQERRREISRTHSIPAYITGTCQTRIFNKNCPRAPRRHLLTEARYKPSESAIDETLSTTRDAQVMNDRGPAKWPMRWLARFCDRPRAVEDAISGRPLAAGTTEADVLRRAGTPFAGRSG